MLNFFKLCGCKNNYLFVWQHIKRLSLISIKTGVNNNMRSNTKWLSAKL